MNTVSLVAMLTTPPHARTTRLGRQVTSASATVASEFLVEDACLAIDIDINSRGAAGEALAACQAGEMVVVTGCLTVQRWLNKRGIAGERWHLAAKQIERVVPGSDAAHALCLEATTNG